MKDYYRVLGIKETACAEDIRARWIELMREFHPDGEGRRGADDRKSQEINEAYQVLKHSSTRVKYDLERAYHRKKRRLYLGRLFLLQGALLVLIILSIVYLKRPRIAFLAKSASPLTRDSVASRVDTAPTLLPSESNDARSSEGLNDQNDLSAPDGADIGQGPELPGDLDDIAFLPAFPESRTLARIQNARPSSTRPKHASDHNQRSTIECPTPADPPSSSFGDERDHPSPFDTRNHKRVSVARFSPVPEVSPGTEEQMVQDKPPLRIPRSMPLNVSVNRDEQIARAESPSVMTTEEEVKAFFANYIERYTQKDIDGFLSLFSPRVIQNGKDGFGRIERMYSDFFDESQELRYHLEEMRIEIHRNVLISGVLFENAAHAEARYEIDQVLGKGGKRKVWKGDISWILGREDGALRIVSLNYQHSKSPLKQSPARGTRKRGR